MAWVVGFVTVTVAVIATAYATASTRLPSAVPFKSRSLSSRTTPGLPREGRIAFPDPDSRGVNAVAWCANGRFLAAADANGEAYVWSVATHKIVAVLPDPHSKDVNAVAVRPVCRGEYPERRLAPGSLRARDGRLGPQASAQPVSRTWNPSARLPSGSPACAAARARYCRRKSARPSRPAVWLTCARSAAILRGKVCVTST
jgi:WD40 repeat protein